MPVSTENIRRWIEQSDIDYITQYIKAWIPFNAWYNAEYSALNTDRGKINAIKKAGGTPLTKKDEFEWLELFEDNKKKAQELQTQITQTEKQIDNMVYDLYGLTQEEREIVENT